MQIIRETQIHDGAVVPSKQGLNVYNDSGSALAAGQLVYISGWTEGSGPATRRRNVKLADADATDKAVYVCRSAAAIGAKLKVYKTYRLTGQNTQAQTVGDRVYLSTTAGGWTATAPATAGAFKQTVGRVAVKSASVGVIEFDLESESDTGVASVDGADVANTTIGAAVLPGATRALVAAEAGVPVRLILDVGDAASGNADFTALPYKIVITGVSYIKTGGAGDAGNSATLHNGITGNAITDAMNNATDAGTDSAATIDDAYVSVAAAATLRVVTVKNAGNNAFRLIIDAVRVA